MRWSELSLSNLRRKCWRRAENDWILIQICQNNARVEVFSCHEMKWIDCPELTHQDKGRMPYAKSSTSSLFDVGGGVAKMATKNWSSCIKPKKMYMLKHVVYWVLRILISPEKFWYFLKIYQKVLIFKKDENYQLFKWRGVFKNG